jgi:hypothetical protein
VLEYCANWELHPASAGLGMLSGRFLVGSYPGLICFAISWQMPLRVPSPVAHSPHHPFAPSPIRVSTANYELLNSFWPDLPILQLRDILPSTVDPLIGPLSRNP